MSTRDIPRVLAALAFLAVLLGPVLVAVLITTRDRRPRLVFGAGLAATGGLWGAEAMNLWLNGYDETPRSLLLLVPMLFLGITLLTLIIVSMVIDSFRPLGAGNGASTHSEGK